MLTGVRRNSKIEVPLGRRRKNCWLLSEKSRTKNRQWKTYQGSTSLIPDGGMCPAFGLLWRTGTPKLAEQGSHPWRSLKQVLNIHFCYYCFAKIQKHSRPLGKTPGRSPITAGRRSLLHSRWIHWAMWCQQPWPGSQSLLCLQHTPPLFPLPAPFPGAGFLRYILSLASSMIVLGLAVTLHVTLWHLPIPAKGTKDVIGHQLTLTPHQCWPPAMSLRT